jgi:hypothetical protein
MNKHRALNVKINAPKQIALKNSLIQKSKQTVGIKN